MQGFRALAYEPMKAHIEELAARNQKLQAEIALLKSSSDASASGDLTSLHMEIANL